MPIRPDPERLRELREDHGTYTALDLARREARAAAIAELRSSIFRLTPLGGDFDVDLRQALSLIADLLEEG